MTPLLGQSGLDLLISPEHRLITFTGAGGKTSLIQWLADHLQSRAQKVVITTTTKIFPPPGVSTILEEDGPDFMGRIRNALKRSSPVVLAKRFDSISGKLIGLNKEVVTTLHTSRLADTILVEADGAARKPLKAPNRHEPVIPDGTELCIGVMGLDAAYRPLTEANVHRHEIFSQITNLTPGEKVTPTHMVRIAMAPNGLFQGCPPACDFCVFLNKTDIPGGPELAEEFTKELMGKEQSSSLEWVAGSVRARSVIALKGTRV